MSRLRSKWLCEAQGALCSQGSSVLHGLNLAKPVSQMRQLLPTQAEWLPNPRRKSSSPPMARSGLSDCGAQEGAVSRLEGQEARRCSEGAPSALRAEHTWAQAQLRVHPACQVGLLVVLGRC